MSIRTKIDFSGITSDNIVTSDNKKYIREDDEIFNSLKDEIAACENAQVQTELATLEILDIKEQTKVIANEAIDTATERAESAAQFAETSAQNAENAQALAETAAINALEAERNVTEFSETLAKLDGDNTFSGSNNFTGSLSISGNNVLTSSDVSSFAKTNTNNTFSGTNNFTGTLQSKGKAVLTSADTSNFAKLNVANNFTGALTVNNNAVLTSADTSNFAKTNTNNTFTGTNTITGSLTVSGKTTLSNVDANKTIITTQFASPAIRHNNGGALYLFPSANTAFKGGFILRAYKEDNTYVDFQGFNDGRLRWAGKDIAIPIETWSENNNWYRKYSDGWMEQGGIIQLGGNYKTITLHQEFANTDYSVQMTSKHETLGYAPTLVPNSVTTTSFDAYVYNTGAVIDTYWQACGFYL